MAKRWTKKEVIELLDTMSLVGVMRGVGPR